MTERVQGFKNGDFTFAVTDGGPLAGEIVVLLHGFPQRANMWDAVCARLEQRGYRTLRFDQRGYARGARPKDVRAYRMGELVRDVRALVSAAGGEPVHLVGHDWGAGVAWAVAARHPSLVRTLTSVSVPHPRAFMRSMLSSTQLFRSYYMAIFQIPGLAELAVSRFPEAARKLLRESGMTDEQLGRVDAEIVAEGTLTNAINWYRALRFGAPAYLRDVQVSTTHVWSRGDVALSRRGADLCGRYVKGPYKLEVLEGSHWIPEEQPDRLSEIIAERAASARSVF